MLVRDFRRVAVVNRGEAAMRLIHAVREHSPDELCAIALHTAAERRTMFVREADEAVCFEDLGVPVDGTPYLDLGALEAALVAARAEAAWVGWGFVAERPQFADLCERMGVVFVGPPASVMRELGDKVSAKRLAEKAGVPMAPWSGGPVDRLDDARSAAREIGFPLMVKAAAGGGGRGIRRVDDPADLPRAFEAARAEAERAFGDPTVFLERHLSDARHVEVQVIADHHGAVWAPGVRDCSVQRRNQKVIEESSSPALDPAHEERLRDAAIRLARAAGYRNAGTVEFLYRPDEDLLAFLEVNTRLQVEHPVTEVTTGLDLVKLQLHVARGGRLVGEPPPATGHAVEARLNAEDAQADFAPSPGRIVALTLPTGPGVRVDTGVAEGDVIAPEYDSMVAKIIAYGRDRDEALARLRRALSQTICLVEEGTTNVSFLLELLRRPEMREGRVDTGWVDRLTAAGEHRSSRLADIALIVGAIDAHDRESALERARFFNAAARGRPQADPAVGHEVALRLCGHEYRVHVATDGARGWYRLTLDGDTLDVILSRLGGGRSRLAAGTRVYRCVSQSDRNEHVVQVDGVTHRLSLDDGGLVRSPAAALVVSMDVRPGDTVGSGDRIGVLEAMKMETAVTAPISGVVEEVLVAANTQVDAGAPLLRIRRTDGGAHAREESKARIRLALGVVPPEDPRRAALERIEALRALVLGFDVTDATAASLLAEHRGDTAAHRHRDVRRAERDLLRAFADLCGLTRERRGADGEDGGVEERSPRELFNAYLRTLEPDREDLPARFRTRLLDALAHYGVTDLARTPELEEAVYRIHRAAQRRETQLPVVVALLERRLEERGDPADLADLQDMLDRLIAATQARYPFVGNLARSVRHRWVDRPVIEESRRRVLEEARDVLRRLVTDPSDADLVDLLVGTPQPLASVVAEAQAFGATPVRPRVIEALTRRYYKIYELGPIEFVERDTLTTTYRGDHGSTRVVASVAEPHDLESALRRVAPVVGRAEQAVVDLYVQLDAATSVDDVARSAAGALAAVALPACVKRVATIAATGRGDAAQVHTLTFRRGDGGSFAEDAVFRGLHPMVGRRLNLWRLENFHLTRLPSAYDTYIFDCVAKENPSDERLIAVAEVRDITPLRDASGTLVAMPELERVLAACLDGIRQARASDPRRQSLEWNRVMLHVWPPVAITLDEVNTVARRLAPLTGDLGLEQVVVQGRVVDAATGQSVESVFRLSYQPGTGLEMRVTGPPTAPMTPLDDYTRKVLQCRRRRLVYPYELVPLLARGGSFVEHDLDSGGTLVGVDRPAGRNTAGLVLGVVSTPTDDHPEGMRRVAVLGDPTKSMGSIAEAECRRLLAALDLAEAQRLPVEWFALSAGARIAMDSGTENLDWVATVLRRIVRFTQDGGEINVVVTGVNVGAQPYWNAEATMLMHTRGLLVMTPDSAMVLTGKQAIDFSGGVSAEDNLGIGGYERVMGPNGQAQYWAPDIARAVDILFQHYDHSYVAPGERRPRRSTTIDPFHRDVLDEPHEGAGTSFTRVGDIFSDDTNPDRKKPFDIRSVMRAVADKDHRTLERWTDMAEAEAAVVMDAHLGGFPVTLIGVESRPLARTGLHPADGPAQWSAGTLFPLSSKKVARAINAASGNRPAVVLANLSGFDGSPESLRRLQLEYGAEIGRAIVNFDGPIVLCVVSRYHGGAFVVFSAKLNDRLEVLAVEGAYASVIGGAPAAAVVFTREVDARTLADPRVLALSDELASAPLNERSRLRTELALTQAAVRNEVLGRVAAEFDDVHSVERAMAVGSVHRIIRARDLRPELIAAVERGLRSRQQ